MSVETAIEKMYDNFECCQNSLKSSSLSIQDRETIAAYFSSVSDVIDCYEKMSGEKEFKKVVLKTVKFLENNPSKNEFDLQVWKLVSQELN